MDIDGNKKTNPLQLQVDFLSAFFYHTFRKRPTFYQDHRQRDQFELSRPVSQDTAGWCLLSPLATWFPNGAAEFQTLPFVLSHGSRNQSLLSGSR
jgi:hypothetical protein